MRTSCTMAPIRAAKMETPGYNPPTMPVSTAPIAAPDLRPESFGNVQRHKEVVRIAGYAVDAEVAVLLAEVPHTARAARYVGADKRGPLFDTAPHQCVSVAVVFLA